MTTIHPYNSHHHLPPDRPPLSYLQPQPQPEPAAAHYASQPADPSQVPRNHLTPRTNSSSNSRNAQALHANANLTHPAADPIPRASEQSAQHHSIAGDMSERPVKRRRSQGPNWDRFYRNGLPSEVIVIEDDTPQPEPKAASRTTKATTSSNITSHATSGTTHTSASRQPVGRPQTQDAIDVTSPDNSKSHPVPHTNPQTSSTRNGQIRGSHASLPSSSNSRTDSAQPLKRKRTRQQEASESKRRRVDVAAAGCHTYKTPPFPPKKAAEVSVPAVADVRILSRTGLAIAQLAIAHANKTF